jgi:hypothetical protein
VDVRIYTVQRDSFTLNSMVDVLAVLGRSQSRSGVRYGRFGTNYLSHFQASNIPSIGFDCCDPPSCEQ